MADDLEGQLERWGAEPAPAPEPAFANRLEADLRSIAYFGRRTPTPEPRRRWVLRPALVMAAVVLVALVGAVVVNVTDRGPGGTLVMGDSRGVTVTLPGGTLQDGGEGLELPDGTIIDVGPGGFASVDGVILPPDSRAVVVDGHLELVDPGSDDPSSGSGETALPTTDTAAPTPTSTPTPTPTARAADNSTRATPSQRTPTVGPTAQPTPAPTRPPADAAPDPTATRTPTTRPTARPTVAPTDTPPVPTPTATPTPTAAATTPSPAEPTPLDQARPRVDLRRTYLGPARAALVWSVTDGDAIAGWEIRVRRGDTVRTVAVIRNGAARELVVERPARNAVFYRVIALSAAGEVLARSGEVRVVAAEVQADG